MLKQAAAAILNNTIAGQLERVGDGLMPKSTNNGEPYAWEYYLASKMEKFCKAKKAAAVKASVKAGVLFDHGKEPMEPGTDQDAYSGSVVRINVLVRKPACSLDGAGFLQALENSASFTDEQMDIITQLAADNTKEARPAHVFTASLITG